jgi:hypothetical protein|uniref:Uncharacterized protein n=1 Tax=Picea glauca TaxID=3330 RepID=A0A101LUV3_PICGL|nr:hypothetical protein ABT39_MTgene2341 [Picea glauca]QHR92285.1 hypothetical protein Q903MT_gene6326 [Picea sitchensis]
MDDVAAIHGHGPLFASSKHGGLFKWFLLCCLDVKNRYPWFCFIDVRDARAKFASAFSAAIGGKHRQ